MNSKYVYNMVNLRGFFLLKWMFLLHIIYLPPFFCFLSTCFTIFCSSIKNARTMRWRTHPAQRDPPYPLESLAAVSALGCVGLLCDVVQGDLATWCLDLADTVGLGGVAVATAVSDTLDHFINLLMGLPC